MILTVVATLSGCTEDNNITPPPSNADTIYVGHTNANYSTIQEAINAAKNGATIILKSGSYNELIDMNKTLTLIGEDKNTTIINFNPSTLITQVPILNINADNCSIENLQITLSNKSVIAQGISINTKNNTIKNTIITNVSNAIELTAYSESNTIIHNQLIHNSFGIYATNSLHNTISYNTFINNTACNIYVSTESDNNNISYNIIESSKTYGIRIKGSQENIVFSNCITKNNRGLYCCCGARSNHFYNNMLFNNSINAEENAGLFNVWYNFPTGGGNYWDDYHGTDANHDGIGDTPYNITGSGNQDLYPLMTPPVNTPCSQ